MVLMVAATTIITPIWLKMDYRKEMRKGKSGDSVSSSEKDNDVKAE